MYFWFLWLISWWRMTYLSGPSFPLPFHYCLNFLHLLLFCLPLPTESSTSVMAFAWCGLCWRTLVQMFNPVLHGLFVHALNMQRYSRVKHTDLLPQSLTVQSTRNRKSQKKSACGSRRKGLSHQQNRSLLIRTCLSPKLSLQPTAA